MPGVTKEQVAAARRMTAIEFLRRYRADDLVKSSARGEFELKSHDSFKINGESSLWHWKSRGIGGKSALDYLVHVEGCSFVEAVRLLCDEQPVFTPPAVQTAGKIPNYYESRSLPALPGYFSASHSEMSG